MNVGNIVRQAAANAAAQHAQGQGWQVQQTIVGPDVTVRPTGQCVVFVRVVLQGGAQHCFEYRSDANGTGALWPVQCT